MVKEKILEKKISKQLTKKVYDDMNKRLDELEQQYSDKWDINYKWNKKQNKLIVNTAQVVWKVIFSKTKVGVYVEAPFFLVPFIQPFKEKCVNILTKELDKLV